MKPFGQFRPLSRLPQVLSDHHDDVGALAHRVAREERGGAGVVGGADIDRPGRQVAENPGAAEHCIASVGVEVGVHERKDSA